MSTGKSSTPEIAGKRVAITRPIERVGEAVEIIESLGGVPVVAPTLELEPAETESLEWLCRKADELDWVIFTSPASIEALFSLCPGFRDSLKGDCKVAVIGPKTALSAERFGLHVDVLPDDYTAEGLLDVLSGHRVEGKLIGIPRTLAAREVLPRGLEEMGARVFVAEAYRSIIPRDKGPALKLVDDVISGSVDAVTFTSPLTVENLLIIAGARKEELIKSLRKCVVAAIGPVTLNKLEEYGIKGISPSRYTVRDMIREVALKLREEG